MFLQANLELNHRLNGDCEKNINIIILDIWRAETIEMPVAWRGLESRRNLDGSSTLSEPSCGKVFEMVHAAVLDRLRTNMTTGNESSVIPAAGI